MADERITQAGTNPEELLEEFAITELEDRLEFVMKCDTNCGCPGPTPPAPPSPILIISNGSNT